MMNSYIYIMWKTQVEKAIVGRFKKLMITFLGERFAGYWSVLVSAG